MTTIQFCDVTYRKLAEIAQKNGEDTESNYLWADDIIMDLIIDSDVLNEFIAFSKKT